MTEDPDAQQDTEVAILLGLLNGGPFLKDQLDSFANQTLSNWILIASDDGSTDNSLAVLDRFAVDHPVQIQAGPRQGFAANFLSLLQAMPQHISLAALSDQDDVWFQDRLERGKAALAKIADDVPALYCARTMVTDASLSPLHPTPLFQRPASFQNALVQSLGGGNTMMLNGAALDLVAKASVEAGEIVAHDWWLYQIISACGGTVINDPEPVLLYRQHGGNVIGANKSAAARWERLKRVLKGDFAQWHDTNIPALLRSEHRMTAQARLTLHHFAKARRGGLISRISALRTSGVYRQSRTGTIALFVACLLGRL